MQSYEEALLDAVDEEHPQKIQSLLRHAERVHLKEADPEYYCDLMTSAIKVLEDAEVDAETLIEYYELALSVFDDYAFAEHLIGTYIEYLHDQKALRTLHKRLDYYIKHVEPHSRVYYAFHRLKGYYLYVHDHYKKAIKILEVALDGYKHLAENSKQDLRPEIFRAYYYIGDSYHYLEAYKASLRYLHEAYTLGKKLMKEDDDNRYHFLMLICTVFCNLRELNHPSELKTWYEKHQEIFESAVKDEPERYAFFWINMMYDYANIVQEDRPDEALELYHRRLELLKGSSEEHGELFQHKLSLTFDKIARIYEKQNRIQDAFDYYKKSLEALETCDELLALESGLHDRIYELGDRIGDYESALVAMEALRKHTEQFSGSSDAYKVKQSDAAHRCSRALTALNRNAEAVSMLHAAILTLLKVHHKAGGFDEKLLGLFDDYVKALNTSDVDEDSAGMYKVTLRFFSRLYEAKPDIYGRRFIDFLMSYANFLAKTRKHKDASKLGNKALNMMEKTFRDDPRKHRQAMFDLMEQYASIFKPASDNEMLKIQHRKIQLYEILLAVDTSSASTYIDLIIDSARRLYRKGAYEVSHRYLDRFKEDIIRLMTSFEQLEWLRLKLLTGMHFEDEKATFQRAKAFFDFFDSLNKPPKAIILCVQEGIVPLKKHVPNLPGELNDWIARFSKRYRRVVS